MTSSRRRAHLLARTWWTVQLSRFVDRRLPSRDRPQADAPADRVLR
ncbi:hypothetical protein [Blastococcus xanthinilyticus]|nr:hypothetical protein [Blastococcus xanthinilyticus]